MSFLLGQRRTVTASFTAGGNPADTTVVLTITAPDGTVTTPAAVHDGTGEYSYDLLLNQAGTWTVAWAGTGAVPASASETLHVVDPSHQGPGEGPCENWVSWDDVADYCTPPEGIGPKLQDAILARATRTLWTRTCKQYGTCSIVRARVVPTCRHSFAWRAGSGYFLRGLSGCGCGSYQFVDLGTAPVVSVDHVWIDGTELAASAYRVDDWRRLVRVDGDSWPNGSSLTANQAGDSTFEVSWTYGVPVPDEGKAMAALYVCKLASDLSDDCGGDPSGMTQKIAEGVTIQINPPDNNTGVAFVEGWLDGFHCGGGGIFDPGARQQTIRVGT